MKIQLSSDLAVSTDGFGKLKFDARFNDLVHKCIPVTREELLIIDHPLFQRLRGVKQFSGTEMIFPGGVHTRFSHSIGAMHVAGMYADTLFAGLPSGSHQIKVARVAALLHDIGHGPWSHASDAEIYRRIYGKEVEKGHDQKRFDLIWNSGLRQRIEAYGIKVQEIADIWTGKNKLLKAIVQGPLGADRLDFLVRDAKHTDTQPLGLVGIESITRSCAIVNVNGEPCLHYDREALSELCHALMGRFHMYREVYWHKVSVAASLLIGEILREAVTALDLLQIAESTEDEMFSKFTDAYVEGAILHSQGELIQPAQALFARYKRRDLPKMCYQRTVPCAEKDDLVFDLNARLANLPAGIKADVVVRGPAYMLDSAQFNEAHVYILSDSGETFTFEAAVHQEGYFKSIIENDTGYYVVRVYASSPSNQQQIKTHLEIQ